MKRRKIIMRIGIVLATIATLIAIIWGINTNTSVADVGSFESYSSGSSSSDWGSSSSDWGSSSDWESSSDWSSSSSSSSRSYGSSSNDPIDAFEIIFFIVVFIIGIAISMASKSMHKSDYRVVEHNTVRYSADSENAIARRIKERDPSFNTEQFKAFAKDVFIKLQNAWTERDWEKIRPLESNELFEQHKAQLQGYIDSNQINVMERICVNWVNLVSYGVEGENEVLVVNLNSRMGDYIIDATTKKVLRGNKNTEYVNTYRLKFTRTAGVKTQEGEQKVNVTNCPNCGAPTTVMTSGKCEYCGSVITTKDYGWVLSSLERHKEL